MSILTQSESRSSAQRKLEEIAIVLRAVRSVSRRCLELTIQGLLNRWVTAGLAGDPLEPAPWCCPRCETDKRSAFRRNGSYTRRLQSLAGLVVLQVPRLRCRCGAHIPLRFPVLEPRRRTLEASIRQRYLSRRLLAYHAPAVRVASVAAASAARGM